ncbi:MAG: hypothetical protein WC455_14330 [Dehalococcoidia bacterium]|jgi:hypothetical protein
MSEGAEMINVDFEELIDELIRAAQDVTNAHEWGESVHGAERDLEEARRKLFVSIEQITDERDSLVVQIKRIADSLQCEPQIVLDVVRSQCVRLVNPNRVPRGIMRHVQEKLNSKQQIFRRGTVEPLYVYASGLQDRVDELEGKR